MRASETQNLAFTLDTGLRALQEPEEDFEFVLASPSSARFAYDQDFANAAFDIDAQRPLPPHRPGDIRPRGAPR